MNLKWLLNRLTHERRKLATVGVLASAGVALLIAGPLLLAGIINQVFAGSISTTLPDGLTNAQAVAQLRAEGRDSYADVVQGAGAVPGAGIDSTSSGNYWPFWSRCTRSARRSTGSRREPSTT